MPLVVKLQLEDVGPDRGPPRSFVGCIICVLGLGIMKSCMRYVFRFKPAAVSYVPMARRCKKFVKYGRLSKRRRSLGNLLLYIIIDIFQKRAHQIYKKSNRYL